MVSNKQTRAKRKTQICKTFRFKIDWDRLNKRQKECLKMMFVEAKWIYNYIISQEDVKSIDYKTLSTIIRKDKDKNDISTQIQYLGSSIKQELIVQVLNQIKGLSVLKKKGHKVGKLRYKSEFNSIKLKQYKVTHYFKGNNKIKVQGIHDPLPLLGMNQLCKYKDNIDYTTANIIYDGINYYVCLTCFIDKDDTVYKRKNPIIGIDLGIKDTITCSDGTKFNISIGESERLKKLQRIFEGQIKGSNNWNKTKKKIRKEYIHIIPWGTIEKLRISQYIGTIAETFGWVLRKNPACTYEEMKKGLQRYQRDAFAELPQFDNEEFFERFKNTEYTFDEFKADYDSMIKIVNTPKYE